MRHLNENIIILLLSFLTLVLTLFFILMEISDNKNKEIYVKCFLEYDSTVGLSYNHIARERIKDFEVEIIKLKSKIENDFKKNEPLLFMKEIASILKKQGYEKRFDLRGIPFSLSLKKKTRLCVGKFDVYDCCRET